jgi:uncharacterized integral membrane protein
MKLSDTFSKAFKNWLKYLVYAIIVFVYIFFYAMINSHVSTLAKQTGNSRLFLILEPIGNSIFGVLIGFEHLINQKKKEGKWVFNIPRFVLLGIPSLFFSVFTSIYYSNISNLFPFMYRFPQIITFSYFYVLCQFLFGYVLITNFSKRNN